MVWIMQSFYESLNQSLCDWFPRFLVIPTKEFWPHEFEPFNSDRNHVIIIYLSIFFFFFERSHPFLIILTRVKTIFMMAIFDVILESGPTLRLPLWAQKSKSNETDKKLVMLKDRRGTKIDIETYRSFGILAQLILQINIFLSHMRFINYLTLTKCPLKKSGMIPLSLN